MKQQQLVVRRNSVADIWPSDEAACQSSHSYDSVARLTMVLTGPQRTEQPADVGRQGPTFLSLAAAIGLFLAFASVLIGTSYLSGLLLERIRSLPQYNRPQAQYSDVWKWQGHR
ncbi:MAG TPA: hypothetical protein VMG82_34915 [Candidatus Sulfotelmatobacter sp.]|nr:hypothetical protein [Candidatus Sulfotelmatobacter sp.]